MDVTGNLAKEPDIITKSFGLTRAGAVDRKKAGKSAKQKMLPYIMILPAMVIFSVFVIYPVFYMLYVSFFDWNMVADMEFIGIENYLDMFTDKDFWKVLGNTFRFMLMMVPTAIILSLAIALYLKKNTRINRILQNVMFMPNIVSLVSISFIWMWMMDQDRGLFNFVLSLFHVDPVNWLGDPKVAMLSLVIVNVWKSLGYYVLIFVAALQGIPGYLYEAAALDRAKPISVFFKITLPMLSPTLFFLILTGIIGSFKTFECVSLMTAGGPADSTNTLVYELYQQGFVYYNTGYASAMGVILMLIVGLMTLIYFSVLQKKVHYQ
jgi:sn-glycerol 3-phosphate transport system permease protein